MPEPSLFTLPEMTTQRLELRLLRPADAEPFRAMTDEPSITDIVDFLPTPFTLADATRLIVGHGDGRDGFWGVWLREDHALIGTVGTHLVGVDEIEIGYWLASARHGRGFATEALAALLPVVAAAFPRRRIFAECRPQNTASWRLLERVGFRPDGTDGKREGRRKLVWHPPLTKA